MAIKILPPQVSEEPGFAERFTREARALAKLSHPNIVAVHDYGQSGGYHYLIMEYVDGVNLRQLQRSGRLSPREALAIVPQICDVLQYAHDEGIVHRDIKPENILIDRKGRVKIADFGLAKILGQVQDLTLTAEGHIMGTPHYMAPEQVEHPTEVDHRADIYSLGVVFYEMLTGELPLGKFQPPSRKVEVDVRLDEVVLRALEKEPQRRYQHASEVKTEVETIATSDPQDAKWSQWERRAAGWRIRCLKCGFTEHWGKYGIRLAAVGRKWTLGPCPQCGRIRIHIIEKGPVPRNVAVPQHRVRLVQQEAWRIALLWYGLIVSAIVLPIGLALQAPIVWGLGLVGLAMCAFRLKTIDRLRPHISEDTAKSEARSLKSEIVGPRRFSRAAIVGACLAPFSFIMAGLWLIAYPAFQDNPISDAAVPDAGPSPLAFLAWVTTPLGLIAFFGTTILGWIAVSQIRRSAGRLYGMELAVFDGLLFPLLALDALIFWLTYLVVFAIAQSFSSTTSTEAVSLGIEIGYRIGVWLAVLISAALISVLVDFLIIRRVWRVVNKSPGGGQSPATPAAAGTAAGPKSPDSGTGWNGNAVRASATAPAAPADAPPA